jgi:DNA-binding MarR family transcriptional regulator
MSVDNVTRVMDLAAYGRVYCGLKLHILKVLGDWGGYNGCCLIRPKELAARLNMPQPVIHRALLRLERDQVIVSATFPDGSPCKRIDFERLKALAEAAA